MCYWRMSKIVLRVIGRLLLGLGLACLACVMLCVVVINHSWHGPR
jgi:hypothetical protein